jgi:hypothetical protein
MALTVLGVSAALVHVPFVVLSLSLSLSLSPNRKPKPNLNPNPNLVPVSFVVLSLFSLS